MAKKRQRKSRMSSGLKTKRNIAREEKRQAKFAAKREAGTAYKYEPNPFKEGTKEWRIEDNARREKAKSSKLPLAKWDSQMRKLKNIVNRENEERKMKKIAKKGK